MERITQLDRVLKKNANLHSFVVTCPNTPTRNWLSMRRKKKRIIATLEKSVEKVSQELTARQAGFSRVTNSINKNFEDILMEVFPDEYMENGVRNWLKIQQDVAFIKKNFKSSTLTSREMVKSIVEKKYQDPLRLIEQRSNARKRQNTCSPMESKLASYGIVFPDKRSKRASTSLLTPNSGRRKKSNFKWPQSCT